MDSHYGMDKMSMASLVDPEVAICRSRMVWSALVQGVVNDEPGVQDHGGPPKANSVMALCRSNPN